MNQKKKKKVDRGKEWDTSVVETKKKKKKRMDDRWCERKNNIKNKK